ncbi:MAG TPA: hypothetical protein VI434_10020 [Candidatus Dormibacteraeota bacterium]
MISIYATYMHPTCKALLAQECTTGVGTPSAAELSAALTAFAGTSTEEQITAETALGEGVLGGDIPSLRTSGQTLGEQIVGTPEYLATPVARRAFRPAHARHPVAAAAVDRRVAPVSQ